MKKSLLLLLTFAFSSVIISCSDDEEDAPVPVVEAGIPDNSEAGPSPYVNPDEANVNIPNVSFALGELGGSKVVNMNMTGIFIKETGEWLNLQGTKTDGQNIWLEIDGTPRSIKAESLSTEMKSSGTALVDLVFLVDNSGSMSEEADLLAAEIESWSNKLETMIDLRLGCVGYDGGYISGGIDMGVPSDLYAFLNREGYYGTSRTYGFEGSNAETLQGLVENYDTGWGECGAAALHFADDNFKFRSGANRLYVNFTDEPNQPNGQEKFSVESVTPEKWGVYQGTIHTVFSGGSYYLEETYTWEPLYEEKPWLLTDYTGGTSILDAPYDFSGVTLDALPVTGALKNSYKISFYFTEDLSSGTHTVKITILSPDGTVKGVKEFTVDFSNL